MRTSEKWNSCKSIPLRYVLGTHHHLPLCNMAKKMRTNEKKKTHQFHVGYMSNPGLNINYAPSEKVESNL